MKLSQAELDTMLALWECEEPIRPAQLLRRMESTHAWSISTLKTLLMRLEEKGAIRVICQKRFHYCTPTLSKEAFLKQQTENLMARLQNASPLPLMASLISDEKITEEELDEIELLLNEAKSRFSDR